MEKSWKEAIKKVLAESATPLHYTEIAEQVLSRGYYTSDGATPAASVNAKITSSIKHEGEQSPFARMGSGLFTLKNFADVLPPEPENTITPSESIIHSFGMYWQRDLVVWRNEPQLFGKQQAASREVDFSKQKGIYVLYDHHTVVYVGRSTERPLGKRLYEHTIDRLSSRWNRFSWFGLLDVAEDGSLCERVLNLSTANLIATLEALLIEALEPPQNRKRGDDFSGIEYIQAIDPELKEREIQNTLRSIERKLRGGT